MTQQMQEQQPIEQPDPSFVISALQEELTRANDNRMYLLAMLRQKDAQAQQMAMQLSQLAGELERMRAEAAVEPADMSGPTSGGN